MTARVRPSWREFDAPIRLGVSSCLLGSAVRYDGGHKRNAFLTELLGAWIEWVPVCPEVELGMGIPRPAIRLERSEDGLRLVEPKSGADHTREMQRFARRRARELAAEQLCGYVFKKDSPSCGLERVKVYAAGGPAKRDGRGLFAAELVARYPELPVEEEGRLQDAPLRENFIERVFAYRRLQLLFRGRWSLGGLVEFHTAHKLLLMAHSPTHYRSLGRLVAAGRELDPKELRHTYAEQFMTALARRATPPRHVNVLEHMAGYLRGRLSQADRAEVSGLIADYRARLVPLIVPITLLRHHVRSLGITYLEGQIYLEPHPKELMLRNHV